MKTRRFNGRTIMEVADLLNETPVLLKENVFQIGKHVTCTVKGNIVVSSEVMTVPS